MELRWDGVRTLADAMAMLKRQVAVTPPPQLHYNHGRASVKPTGKSIIEMLPQVLSRVNNRIMNKIMPTGAQPIW